MEGVNRGGKVTRAQGLEPHDRTWNLGGAIIRDRSCVSVGRLPRTISRGRNSLASSFSTFSSLPLRSPMGCPETEAIGKVTGDHGALPTGPSNRKVRTDLTANRQRNVTDT